MEIKRKSLFCFNLNIALIEINFTDKQVTNPTTFLVQYTCQQWKSVETH